MLNEYKEGNGKTQMLLFGTEVGKVLSRVQGTIVSTGTLLEDILESMCEGSKQIQFQMKFLDPSTNKFHVADLYISDERPEVIELKLGFEFDTKKARQEIEDITETSRVASIITGRKVGPSICLFNAENKDDIDKFKADIPRGARAYTGEELCERIGISFYHTKTSLSSQRQDRRKNLLSLIVDAVRMDDEREFVG